MTSLSAGFQVLDLATGKAIRKFKVDAAEENRALPILLIHGGHAIVCGSACGEVNIWFVDSGRKLPALQIPSTLPLPTVIVSARS